MNTLIVLFFQSPDLTSPAIDQLTKATPLNVVGYSLALLLLAIATVTMYLLYKSEKVHNRERERAVTKILEDTVSLVSTVRLRLDDAKDNGAALARIEERLAGTQDALNKMIDQLRRSS